jgi:hypothetical protein
LLFVTSVILLLNILDRRGFWRIENESKRDAERQSGAAKPTLAPSRFGRESNGCWQNEYEQKEGGYRDEPLHCSASKIVAVQ